MIFKKDSVHFMIYYNEKVSTLKGATEQKEMINKIKELKHFTLLAEKGIKNGNTENAIKKAKTKTQRK